MIHLYLIVKSFRHSLDYEEVMLSWGMPHKVHGVGGFSV